MQVLACLGQMQKATDEANPEELRLQADHIRDMLVYIKSCKELKLSDMKDTLC